MVIRHNKAFVKGLLLLASFFIMAAIMLMPIFPAQNGQKLTSLQYADMVFNSLSKGSSNFFPEVAEAIKNVSNNHAVLSAAIQDRGLAQAALTLLAKAGVEKASDAGGVISWQGPLKTVLSAALRDSEELYHNNGAEVSQRYDGLPPLEASRAWWHLLQPAVKELQRAGALADAKAVDTLIKKAIEPANNFYGISDANVADNLLLMIAMLAFYILYAIWYGFGIYNIFDGLALMGNHGEKA